jgi:putative endonuclease
MGSTNRLAQRIREHNQGRVRSTKAYLPLEIVYKEVFLEERSARSRERQLKDRRIEKERIIAMIEK